MHTLLFQFLVEQHIPGSNRKRFAINGRSTVTAILSEVFPVRSMPTLPITQSNLLASMRKQIYRALLIAKVLNCAKPSPEWQCVDSPPRTGLPAHDLSIAVTYAIMSIILMDIITIVKRAHAVPFDRLPTGPTSFLLLAAYGNRSMFLQRKMCIDLQLEERKIGRLKEWGWCHAGTAALLGTRSGSGRTPSPQMHSGGVTSGGCYTRARSAAETSRTSAAASSK